MTKPTQQTSCTVYVARKPVPYAEGLQLQTKLAAARGQDSRPDTLLLLEHPHVYTLGSAASEAHLLMSSAERLRRGVTVYYADRGGDITYHGPGQVVGYPIIALQRNQERLRTDVVAYIRDLEAVLIQALAEFGIHGQRLTGFSGVWVVTGATLAKIAAIGVKVTVRSVTYHGFALNVNPDMSFFSGIIPCGIEDKPVTSMQQVLGAAQTPTIDRVQAVLVQAFANVFERNISRVIDLSRI